MEQDRRSKMAGALPALEPHLEMIVQALEQVIDGLGEAHPVPDIVACLMSAAGRVADAAGHQAQAKKHCRALLMYFAQTGAGTTSEQFWNEFLPHAASLQEVFGTNTLMEGLLILYGTMCSHLKEYETGATNCTRVAGALLEEAAGAHKAGHA